MINEMMPTSIILKRESNTGRFKIVIGDLHTTSFWAILGSRSVSGYFTWISENRYRKTKYLTGPLVFKNVRYDEDSLESLSEVRFIDRGNAAGLPDINSHFCEGQGGSRLVPPSTSFVPPYASPNHSPNRGSLKDLTPINSQQFSSQWVFFIFPSLPCAQATPPNREPDSAVTRHNYDILSVFRHSQIHHYNQVE